MIQVAILQSLTYGDYNGSITAAELKQKGDTGIGTFDALNGEMIVIDGSIEEVPDDETIPFSNVTFFDADETQSLEAVNDINELKNVLNEKVLELGVNRFYMIRIDGAFSSMNVRSEYSQTEPYKPLATVLETDQTFFDYENLDGTVVGLYCPSYMESLNAVGWHFHFISYDRLKGVMYWTLALIQHS